MFALRRKPQHPPPPPILYLPPPSAMQSVGMAIWSKHARKIA